MSKKKGVDVLFSGIVPYLDDAAKLRDLRGTVHNQAAVKAKWDPFWKEDFSRDQFIVLQGEKKYPSVSEQMDWFMIETD